jgi:outer membrane protein assembly factor BamB
MTRRIDQRIPLLALLTLLLVAAVSPAGNWPRFRGPNGTGEVEDKNVPVTFDEKENMLWKTAIPGVGHSSPIIWGDSLFLESASKDGKDRWLICVNTKDGSIRWQTPIAGGKGTIHPRNTLASSTPATDGERIYSVYWDGLKIAMYAHDFKGHEVWHRDLGDFESQHGVGHSPMVYDGKVIFANDQDGYAELVALDARTGEPVWQAKRRAFRACYSTPFIMQKDKGPVQLIVASTSGITSYDPAKGTENWDYSWKFTAAHPLRTVASPSTNGDLIFINSGDGDGSRHTIAVKVGNKGDDASKNLAWEAKKTFPYVPTMLSHGKHLFWVNDAGLAGCTVAASGEEVWTERLGNPVSASPIMVNGNIYAVSEKGDVYVFAASAEFKLLGKSSVHEVVFASPACADGKLYVRGKENLFCIGKKTEK